MTEHEARNRLLRGIAVAAVLVTPIWLGVWMLAAWWWVR